jgi:hypothetical protein
VSSLSATVAPFQTAFMSLSCCGGAGILGRRQKAPSRCVNALEARPHQLDAKHTIGLLGFNGRADFAAK